MYKSNVMFFSGGRFPDLAALLEVLVSFGESEGLTVDADASKRGTRYAEANSGGSRSANSSSEESKSSASWTRQTDRTRCYGETGVAGDNRILLISKYGR